MINFILRNVFVYSIILFLFSFKISYAESLEDLKNEINDIRDKISNLEKSNIPEAITIDKSIKEIDDIIDFANENINKGEIDVAISSLNFAEKTISDISKIIPKMYSSEVISENLNFTEEQNNQILEINKNISANKILKSKDLASDIIEIEKKGLPAIDKVVKLSEYGVVSGQQMINDIIEAGSSENYINSEAYKSQDLAIREFNKAMQTQVDAKVRELWEQSKADRVSSSVLDDVKKEIGSDLSSEIKESVSDISTNTNEVAADIKQSVADTVSEVTEMESLQQEMRETIDAQSMIDDIMEAGSTEEYVNSEAYKSQDAQLKELNKKMQEEVNKTLQKLLDGN
ncbi:hypothetical protein N8892_00375 [Candidatus Pelagibacter sp.]|nr:hypothetical protein [Candidatus Pelagibacter sp.]